MENLGEWDHSEDHPDYDPNLLNVDSWAVENQEEEKPRSHSKKKRSTNNNSWGDQWSSLGVGDFDHNDDGTGTADASGTGKEDEDTSDHNNNTMHSTIPGLPNETVEAAMEAAVAAISETTDSVNSGDRSGSSSENNTYMTQHLHPLGIQSSASCPAPSHTNSKTQTTYQPQFPQHQQQNTHQGLCSVDLSRALERSVASTPGVATAGAPTTTTPTMTNTSTSATQHLSSLAANFMLAQAADSNVAATAAAAAAAAAGAAALAAASSGAVGDLAQDHNQHSHPVVTQPSTVTSTNPKTSGTSETTASSQQNGNRARQTRVTSSKARTKKNSAQSKNTTGTNASAAAAAAAATLPPPFYLFDAPIELRANFMQNQRRLGLPIQQDPNSYHYGESVNGFHPHQFQVPLGAAASTSPAPNGPAPPLIDARHGNHRRSKNGQVGQVKNEREQKRAQKITELIEQLRLQMEEGGWQVEARSKFHTLSNCAQYIKHMIKLTSEKEKANQKLNSDLDEKRRKLERETEEKSIQEGRSDPESVTSSLTSDTTMSTARHKQEEETSRESNGDETKKRRLQEISSREGSFGDDSNNNSNDDNDNSKKRRTVSSEATNEESSGDDNRGGGSGTGSGSGNSRTGSGTGSGSGNSGCGNSGSGSGTGSGSGNSGSGGPSAQGCSISKTISTVSELTDSNRGSSSNNSGSGGGSSDDQPTEQDSRESTSGNGEDGAEDQPSNSSISSDAAVASEKTSRDRHTGHKDVVFNNDKRMSRKRPPDEVTSLERSFELNYEEVFDKSNIPQLIASTSGKIVTWNECFAKATGYRKAEIEKMTIFSLVKPENLASFFEIVAAALRPDDEAIAKAKEKNLSSIGAAESNADSNMNTESTERERTQLQNVLPPSASSQDSFGDRDTVKCSNNEMVAGEEGNNESTDSVLSANKETGISSNSNTHKTNFISNDMFEAKMSKASDESGDSSEEFGDKSGEEGSNETSKNIFSGDSNEDSSEHSNEREGSSSSGNSNMESNHSSSKGDAKPNIIHGEPGEDTSGSELGVETPFPRRLLNYTAMTLPCIDFPTLKKLNQAAAELNSPSIPPLHVTVTLMPDADPRRRCFHCVFTNSKGTNGSLGIITPELLASLFSQPLRSSRRKKNYYKTHENHQHKRARVDTTRVGQSVSTNAANDDERQGRPPSPLLMPPPGPPSEENPKPDERESKKVKMEEK